MKPKNSTNFPSEELASLPHGLPNPWGLYDTLVNVWEWCSDAWHREYSEDSVTDPKHEGEASADRVIRGASWSDVARDVRAAYRHGASPGARSYSIGFRCRVL